MKRNAVLVDVSIDQGGCFETSRPTTHSDPTYEVDGITHYCVANMPGAVPITSTYALTNSTLPYVTALADHGLRGAIDRLPRPGARRERGGRRRDQRPGGRRRRRRPRPARPGARAHPRDLGGADHERLRSRQPRHRRDRRDVRDDHRRPARRRHRQGRRRPSGVGPLLHRGRPRRAAPRRGQAPCRPARLAGPDHRSRDGQADRAGARRGRLLRRDLRLLRRQRRGAAGRRADRRAGGRRLGALEAQLARRAPGDHAVELPLLPGGSLRGPQPGHRQHDPAQARAPVPRVGRGPRGHVPRGRRAHRRLHQHLRDQRADRVGDRRPAGPGRVPDRVRAGGRRGGRDRRPPPQEGGARAGGLGPVHPAEHR